MDMDKDMDKNMDKDMDKNMDKDMDKNMDKNMDKTMDKDMSLDMRTCMVMHRSSMFQRRLLLLMKAERLKVRWRSVLLRMLEKMTFKQRKF